MLAKGSEVQDFELDDQFGKSRRLSTLLETGPVVLFFYPKAMTTGCTRESCHFRDLSAEFEAVGAQPVGISADSVDRQSAFDAQNGLGMPLLSDPSRKVAAMFGVKRPGPLVNRRATFVIARNREILGAFSSEMNMNRHADDALAVLKANG